MTDKTAGCDTRVVNVPVQPLASETVTVYVPVERLVSCKPLPEPLPAGDVLVQFQVNGPEEPVIPMVIFPSDNPLQDTGVTVLLNVRLQGWTTIVLDALVCLPHGSTMVMLTLQVVGTDTMGGVKVVL